jgi:endonuclease YncB( thermonuclease family)
MSEQTVDQAAQPQDPRDPTPVVPQQSTAPTPAEPAAEPSVAADATQAPVTDSPAAEVPQAPGLPVDAPAADAVPADAPQPFAVPQAAAGAEQAKPARDRRRMLRAVGRWAAAAVVFAAVGTGAAYGITSMERTDVPGLATESDGRWDYPELVLPPLPEGSPAPFAEDNPAGAHYADLRELLLPAPKGATADKGLAGDKNGWLPKKTFLAAFEKDDREDLSQLLVDNGLRHIAARGWTMPDGTRTEIYLLHFNTAEQLEAGVWDEFTPFGEPGFLPAGTEAWKDDDSYPAKAEIRDVVTTLYTEDKPYGDGQSRQAYLSAGDTLAVITQTGKGTAPAVPFQQTVALQSQLLG